MGVKTGHCHATALLFPVMTKSHEMNSSEHTHTHMYRNVIELSFLSLLHWGDFLLNTPKICPFDNFRAYPHYHHYIISDLDSCDLYFLVFIIIHICCILLAFIVRIFFYISFTSYKIITPFTFFYFFL